MLPLTPDHDFQTQLAQARLEALTILRRAMTDEEHPPGKEAIQAATAILRLPKHLTTTPCHAGDEPPSSSPSSSEPTANPRVSPAPHSSPSLSEPPATPEGRCEAHPRVPPSPHPSPTSPHPTLSITPTLNLINRLLTAPLDTPEDKLLRLLSELPTSPPRTESS